MVIDEHSNSLFVCVQCVCLGWGGALGHTTVILPYKSYLNVNDYCKFDHQFQHSTHRPVKMGAENVSKKKKI